jgi:Holliday junction resolvase-like predicted endonuclease
MRLRRLAAAWLREARPGGRCELRFDVASVRDGSLTVLEGAF